MVSGKSIADWTAGWLTWESQAPAVGNPFDDTTGALAHQNNDGPVFYVAGSFSPPVVRHFSVTYGTPILFAVLDVGSVQYPVSDLQVLSTAFFNAPQLTLFASIDGVPLSPYGLASNIFSMGPAIPNTLGEFFLTPGFTGDPACSNFTPDLLCPSQENGYWFMAQLSPGLHVIHMGGSINYTLPNDNLGYGLDGANIAFSQDTTDYISVVPEPASALLILPGVIGLAVLRQKYTRVMRALPG
jgi:hypothetical protein